MISRREVSDWSPKETGSALREIGKSPTKRGRVKKMKYWLVVISVALLGMCSKATHDRSLTREIFSHPPIRYWPRPLWFWNNTEVTVEGVVEQMQAFRDKCGYGGFGPLPFGKNFSPEYLSEPYLKIYGAMLEKARELGMTVSLYDEFGFPSGSVGAFAEGDDTPRFQRKYPELTIQRLDKAEDEITGPRAYEKKIPDGKLMGIVAMEWPNKKRLDLTALVAAGILKWKAPPGRWKIMFFMCVIDGEPIADYLNPEAAVKFTGMAHDVYHDRFRDYFESVISGTFFDEPSMFHAQFRMWTPLFNEKFIEKYGFNPVPFYPALWEDIGPDTPSARNYLFGFRAELFARGFTKVVSDWSVAHGITATGHFAPEEAVVPANASGDLMKSFQYLEIPGIDKIGGHRPAERFYKLVSSAAYNWDKHLVMSETYGAMPNYDEPGDLSWDEIYAIAMDQYTKGINALIPHAVWYDTTKVTYKPELSHRNPLYAGRLKEYTTFLARLNVMLQPAGRHVADIAVLYPIHSLLAQHYFYAEKGPATIDGWVDPVNQFYKDAVKQIDYVDVANWLINTAGKDFTFIHPEVLDEKCAVSGARLRLQNKDNYEEYRVIIVPSCVMISVSNLKKVVDFYDAGGTVVFTTRLPLRSSEMGKDREVADLVRSIFPGGENEAGLIKKGQAGGMACFISSPDGGKLNDVLAKTGIAFDVAYPSHPDLQYIHKIIDGRDVFYFANLGGSNIETEVELRGRIRVEEWDPHTGGIQKRQAEFFKNRDSGACFTKVKLSLKPYHSCFWVGGKRV
jgi:hypothetical protein